MLMTNYFTDEEIAFLAKNEKDNSKQVSWEMVKQQGIIFYCLSGIAKLVLEEFEKNNIPVLWIIDKQYAGTTYNGIEVKSPASLSEANDAYVLVATGYSRAEVTEICEAASVKNLIFLENLPYVAPGYFKSFNFISTLNSNQNYLKLYNLVEDEESRQVLKSIFSYRITHDYDFFKNYSDKDHYFPEKLKEKFDYSVFCDCGAYNGDTFLVWLQQENIEHRKYIAIEASKNNYLELEKTVKNTILKTQKNIEMTLHYCAVGKEKGKVTISDSGCGSMSSSYGNEVDLLPLDDILPESVTFIKMDIEGAETDALHGLKSILEKINKQNKKNLTLAISVYHLEEDLYSLPFLILKYAPAAKIYMRHHTNSFSETVCYAII